MAKTQMLKMVIPSMGIYKVHYDDKAKYNPWVVTREYSTLGEYGRDKHKNIIAKYGDYYSCMCNLKKLVWDNNRERM